MKSLSLLSTALTCLAFTATSGHSAINHQRMICYLKVEENCHDADNSVQCFTSGRKACEAMYKNKTYDPDKRIIIHRGSNNRIWFSVQ